jgi:hypothetical protein
MKSVYCAVRTGSLKETVYSSSTEMKSVYCAVRTGSLNVTVYASSVKGVNWPVNLILEINTQWSFVLQKREANEALIIPSLQHEGIYSGHRKHHTRQFSQLQIIPRKQLALRAGQKEQCYYGGEIRIHSLYRKCVICSMYSPAHTYTHKQPWSIMFWMLHVNVYV